MQQTNPRGSVALFTTKTPQLKCTKMLNKHSCLKCVVVTFLSYFSLEIFDLGVVLKV